MGPVGYSPTNNFVGLFLAFFNSTVEPFDNGHLGERQKVKLVERFKQESVYGLSTKKTGCCREGAVNGDSTVLLIFEIKLKAHNIFCMKENIFSFL